MKVIIPALLSLIVALGACTPSGEGTTTDKAAEPDSKAAVGDEAPAKDVGQELLVRATELRVDGDVVWFEPGSGVQRTHYIRYAFDKADFEKIVGSAKPDSDFFLVVSITKTEEKNHTPTDPSSPSPDGGFQITIHHAKVLRLK